MQTYNDALFDPPAPLAQITLRNPEGGETLPDVPMLLDSGADVTLIPQASVDRLGLTGATEQIYESVSFDGSTSFASAVRLDMVFLNRTFRGRYLLFNQEWGVIGRDILNLVSLLLDGPNLTWSEQHPRP